MGRTAIVVDDHEILRLGLRQLLRFDLGYLQVVGVGTRADAVALAEMAPETDLIVFDLAIADLGGEGGVRDMRRTFPASKLVAIGAATRDDIIKVLSAGAHGYIDKAAHRAEIASGLDQVAAGRIVIPASIAELPEREQARGGSAPSASSAEVKLTPRQRDVLRELGKGRSTKEIARALDLSESTVKIHLVGLYRQLGVQSRTQAVLTLGKRHEDAAAQPTHV